MSLTTYFRALLLIYSVLIFGDLASAPVMIDALPEPLRKFAHEDWTKQLSDERVEALTLLQRCALPLMGVSILGLAALWRPARTLFTAFLLCIAVITVLTGPNVQPELNSVLSFMEDIISGLILGMIYFSPLREHFDRKEDDPAPR